MTDGSDSAAGLGVFDDLAEGVLAFTDEGRFIYANRAARILYRADDLVGRAMDEFRPGRSSVLLAAEIRTLLHEGHMAGEHTIRCPDGSVASFRFRSVANHRPGVHLTVMHAAQPGAAGQSGATSAPDRSQQDLLRAIFENIPDPVLVISDDRRYVDGNRAGRRLLGLKQHELVGRSVGDFTPEDERADVDRIWSALLEGRSARGRRTLVAADGVRRTVAFRLIAGIAPGRHLLTLRLARAEDETAPALTGPVPQLTAREREVLALLACGHNAEAIARRVSIAPQTARTHIRNALRKLGARTRPHAVAIALQQAQIHPPPG